MSHPASTFDVMGPAAAAMFALPGLATGSFLTVVAHRMPAKQSIVAPRSACPSCGTQLRAVDNIPVVSYVLLRGRCRTCGSRISPFYPLMELAGAGLFAGAAIRFDRPFVAVIMALFLGVLLVSAVIDLRHRIIPNRLVYPALAIFAALVGVGGLLDLGVNAGTAALGLLAFGGGLLLLALVSPRGMGMGDVKLGGLIGLVLGSVGLRYVAVAAAAAVLLGGAGAVVALLLGRSRKQTIPFGPYLAAGAAFATFYAPEAARVYLHTLT